MIKVLLRSKALKIFILFLVLVFSFSLFFMPEGDTFYSKEMLVLNSWDNKILIMRWYMFIAPIITSVIAVLTIICLIFFEIKKTT